MRMKRVLLIFLGTAVGIGGSVALRQILKKPPTPLTMPSDPAKKAKLDDEERRKVAWKIISPRIEMAQKEALKAIDIRSQDVRDFFAEREKRIPAYAERVLSFRSKWELAKSNIPGADKDAHTRFLKEEFSKIVFSEAELGYAVSDAADNYVRDIQAIENALLIKIRADLNDVPACAGMLPDLNTDILFRERFVKVVGGLSDKAGTDAKVDVGRLVGSEIAAAITIRVGIAVATRLGVSSAILGTGTAAAPETLGVSIVAGIIVDQIAGWAIGWFYDPEGEIGKKLAADLNGLSALIISGDTKTRGLKQELRALAERRNLIRNAALQEMILQPRS